VLNALLGLALAGGAIGGQALGLDSNEASAPLTYVGAKGEDTDAGRFSVRVDSFSTARAIETGTKTVPTDQLFLVVNAAATAAVKPLRLAQPTLLTQDGLRFTATDKIGDFSTLANKWVQPGYWVSGSFFFDVPPSALAGARIVFDLPAQAITEPYRPEVEIDLGLEEEAAKKLAATPQDLYSLTQK
jgi:hypothetical protein